MSAACLTPMLFPLEPGLPLLEPLVQALQCTAGVAAMRRFPDGESYLRVESDVRGRTCLILANLADPDNKFLPLYFLATTLKELGAGSVGLVAPYLCYMRQDSRFMPGEAITSGLFAQLLSNQVDWLVTLDPHLHRYRNLSEIYSIPTIALQAAPALADWLAKDNEDLLLVGPDAESEQWVKAIAERIHQPFVVGSKARRGDRDVTVTLPDLSQHLHRTAVIVDDVIASGHTLLDTLSSLKTAGFKQIDCAAVHGIFAGHSDITLMNSGLRRLITSNSIPHASNAIDISHILAGAIEPLIYRP